MKRNRKREKTKSGIDQMLEEAGFCGVVDSDLV